MIHFGNSFSFVISKLRKADDKTLILTATGDAQLKTRGGDNIGDSVSLVHQGGGDYRATFPSSIFNAQPLLAVGKQVVIQVTGSAPAFQYDLLEQVSSRG